MMLFPEKNGIPPLINIKNFWKRPFLIIAKAFFSHLNGNTESKCEKENIENTHTPMFSLKLIFFQVSKAPCKSFLTLACGADLICSRFPFLILLEQGN